MPEIPALELHSRLMAGTSDLGPLIPDLGKLPPSAKLLMLGCKQDLRQLRLQAVKDLLLRSHALGGEAALLPDVAKALGFTPGPIASVQLMEQPKQPPAGLPPLVPGLPLVSLLESETLWGSVAWIMSEFFSDPAVSTLESHPKLVGVIHTLFRWVWGRASSLVQLQVLEQLLVYYHVCPSPPQQF